LQEKGIDVVMLTGDNHETAQAVATELNLTDFKANMLPENKLKEVENLQQNYLIGSYFYLICRRSENLAWVEFYDSEPSTTLSVDSVH
jgi:magnesium-transporting ATPase (P-type)